MKKKLLLCLCTFALMIGLVACGSTDNTVGGYDPSAYQQLAQNYITSLESIGETDIDTYIASAQSSDDSVTEGLLEDWKDCLDVKGDFLAFYTAEDSAGVFGNMSRGWSKGFSVEKSGKTITATQVCDYSDRDLKLIIVFNANSVDDGPTAINIEPVYNLGETMQKAGLNTVMGIGIVFVMLIVLSGVIKAFEIVPYLEKKFAAKSAAPAEVKPATPVAAAPKAATDDLELVAVIAAAIAASTGASTDSFVVRSIKKRH